MNDSEHSGISKKKIYGAGTVLALIVSVPAIIAFVVAEAVINDFFISIAISAIVYFVAMGFSIRISKKLSAI